MSIHIHDCHEIYYSISGGKQFFINGNHYTITPGDIFFISANESHHLTHVDYMTHERINFNIYPDFLKQFSCASFDMESCFKDHDKFPQRIHLDKNLQGKFNYFIKKLQNISGDGSEILENAVFCELMVMLNSEHQLQNRMKEADPEQGIVLNNDLVEDILEYINKNLTASISIAELAEHFYITESYVCRIFKKYTGTTIKEYIAARRISLVKAMIDRGIAPGDAYLSAGFTNYNTFYKTFIRIVGTSPTNYSRGR